MPSTARSRRTQRSQFFDGASTNEIPVGRTAADGTGQVFFEMQTGLEAPGLGCGQNIDGRSPDCFLVVVPRGSTEVDGTTVGDRSDNWMVSSPLSATNWANRLVVPLQFSPIGASCSFGRPETPTAGTDFVTEAITAWQPELCGLGRPATSGFTSLIDDTTRRCLPPTSRAWCSWTAASRPCPTPCTHPSPSAPSPSSPTSTCRCRHAMPPASR